VPAAPQGAHDLAELDLLYERYASAVYSLALAIVDDTRTAEEVLIETFYRSWEGADPVRADTRSDAERLLGLAEAEARRRCPPGTGEYLDARHLRMMTAFATLPQNQRRALELAWHEGLSEREIAGRLGISPRAVRRLWRLGFAHLRSRLPGGGHEANGLEYDRPVLTPRSEPTDAIAEPDPSEAETPLARHHDQGRSTNS
jgi:RNA polymerase sigma-70 factor (ECF subfamily)